MYDWIITLHAVEQFIRRWEPKKSFEQAEEELFSLLNTSRPDGKTPLGDAIRISGHRPAVRMVIKDRVTCVSVLPTRNIDRHDLYDYDSDVEDYVISNDVVEERRIKIEADLLPLRKELEDVNKERAALGARKIILMNEISSLERRLHYQLS